MPYKLKTTLIILAIAAGLALSFGTGYNVGLKILPTPVQGLEPVVETWGLIMQDYVDKDKIDTSQLSQGAIEGMLAVLDDPHTLYLNPETFKLASSNLEGKFEGIGAEVTVKDGQLTIIAPVIGSPAEKLGIRPGDKILEVDGKPTAEMTISEAIFAIRGPKGTSVRLLVLHEGESEPVEIVIVRAEIQETTVRYEMMGDIAYIRITQFSWRTDDELSDVLHLMNMETPAGLILDLRSNAGGVLQEVVDVASHFLTDGIVLSAVDNEGQETALPVKHTDIVTDLPMVVLVDSYSASGSEVLAGALQDYHRATIAGTTTYGKGSINTMHQLQDGSGLYLTIARWLTPGGRLIEGAGIEPDYEIETEGEVPIQWAIDYLKSNK
jgi:carboxyl-terminal processing protease